MRKACYSAADLRGALALPHRAGLPNPSKQAGLVVGHDPRPHQRPRHQGLYQINQTARPRLPRSRSKFGYLCVEAMEFPTGEETIDPQTGEVTGETIAVLPSHYKCPQTGAALPVENPHVWVYREEAP